MPGLLKKIFKGKASDSVDISRVAKNWAVSKDPKPDLRSARKSSFIEITAITDTGYKRNGIAIDVSETGARLRFHSSERWPQRFRLKIPKLKLDCEVDVVWHKGVDIGVRFKR